MHEKTESRSAHMRERPCEMIGQQRPGIGLFFSMTFPMLDRAAT
jgi:hypothetical protein